MGLLFGQPFEVIHRGTVAGDSWQLRLRDGRTLELADQQAENLLVVIKLSSQNMANPDGHKAHA